MPGLSNGVKAFVNFYFLDPTKVILRKAVLTGDMDRWQVAPRLANRSRMPVGSLSLLIEGVEVSGDS